MLGKVLGKPVKANYVVADSMILKKIIIFNRHISAMIMSICIIITRKIMSYNVDQENDIICHPGT
jgi:hypothetical protein